MLDNNTSVATNWVFRVSRWVGATPYSSSGKFSKALAVYSIFWTLLVSIPCCTVRIIIRRSQLVTGVLEIGVSISAEITLGLSLLAHAVQSINKRREIEVILHSATIRHTSPSERVLLVLVILLYPLTLLCIAFRFDLQFFFGSTAIISATFFNILIVLQFGSTMEAINCHIQDAVKGITKGVTPERKIFHAIHLKSKSLHTAQAWNRLTEWNIMLTVIQHWGFIVKYVFLHVLDGWHFGKTRYPSLLVYSSFCTMLGFVKLWIIVDKPQRLAKSAEAFDNELFKLLRSNRQLCRDRRLFLYVTLRQKVNFTACGFFTLGYELVTSMITAATTYLVILLQFSMPAHQ